MVDACHPYMCVYMELNSAGRCIGEGLWASGPAHPAHQGAGQAPDGTRLI